MNILSNSETYGLILALIAFAAAYGFIHVRYIRHHALHKRFLEALWKLMKNTIHGQHIRTLGYKEESESNKEQVTNTTKNR
ncbi:hypothetical protein RJD38_19280 [Vibrio scophthalmi]|uniref:Uncharacterized protein n=2 Tax=Vibrio scophthalmi TaxID=45658 RepID=F9RIU3_9VIBR|nr:hypothetical protein [Vibrio scophthalmi]ANS87661.1 hypothetical protein VSVS12_03961 [Vibrio scophthalmi]ANU38352.1 hypothetical protein VSVS05_03314 [Vibrio scophthalmi]EGU41855.1 hypothetical protein VIS19158_10629 [Vibrio scophthalmi LMG 19158]